MAVLKKKTRKGLSKQLGKLVKKHGAEMTLALISGIVSSLAADGGAKAGKAAKKADKAERKAVRAEKKAGRAEKKASQRGPAAKESIVVMKRPARRATPARPVVVRKRAER
jgi:hypothetical protein